MSDSTGSHDERRVLILGAGLVSRPAVRHFLALGHVRLTVASLDVAQAVAVVNNHPRAAAIAVDVTDPRQLEPLVRQADLVISLVPYEYHARVARFAIRHGVSMVTTSYVQPEMRDLDAKARRAGVTILNEVGLDPGIDHMSAMRMIDAARADEARIVEFRSCCGGLPAPEAADNPWKYKFSWSPRGALLAARLAARYLEQGRVISVPGDALFEHTWPYDVEDVGRFEIYPNRDSLRYIEAYGLHEIQSMLRATIRYPGWTATLRVLGALGMLELRERDWPAGTTYAGFCERFLREGSGSLKSRLARSAGLAEDDPVIERIEWAGLFADEALPDDCGTPLDVLAHRFQERMRYAEGERDMVVLRHELVTHRVGARDERRISLLVAYGEPGGESATSRTVALTAAVAGELLLAHRIEPGVHIPTSPEVYTPILERLAQMGIGFREWSEDASRH